MSDSKSDTSFESCDSTKLLEEFINLGVHQSLDNKDEGARCVKVISALQERYGNVVPITRRLASTILEINSPYYNAVLNNKISFSFDAPIETTNSGNPTPVLMDPSRQIREWSSQNFVEYHEATLREIPIYSGTIHQVALWSCQQMPARLFEITAQLIGIAQKNPSLLVCKGNEVILLIRDLVEHDPVLQVSLPYFLYPRIPRISVGEMINCVGVMVDTHLMQAVRIYIDGLTGDED